MKGLMVQVGAANRDDGIPTIPLCRRIPYRWPQDRGTWLALGLTLYAIACILWIGASWNWPTLAIENVQLLFLPALPLVALLALRRGVDRSLGRDIRHAWCALGVSFLLYWFGELLWSYYSVADGKPPLISWADAAYLLSYPVLFWGLVRFRIAARFALTRLFWLDAAIVLLGTAALGWHMLLGPLAEANHDNGWLAAWVLVYPIADLALLVGIVAVVLCQPPAEINFPLRLLATGLILVVVADFSWGYLALNDAFQSGHWPDAIWIAGAIFLAWSPQAQRWSSRASTQTGSRPRLIARLVIVLPYVALVSAYALILAFGLTAGLYRQDLLVFRIGIVASLLVIRQVMTHRQNLQLLAQQQRSHFLSLVQNASDLITVVDRDTTIFYQTPSVERLLGYTPEVLAGTRLLDLVHPDDRHALLAVLTTLNQRSGPDAHIYARLRRSDNTWCVTETIVSDLRDDRYADRIVLNTRDVTERKRLEDKLIHQAYHDSLTGLPNRALFMSRLTQALAELDNPSKMVAVLFLDLDNFKVINDSLGHHDGDQLLISVARRLRRVMREGDTIARLGGDEFTVLLEDIDSVNVATEVAERIIEALRSPLSLSGRELVVGTSIGIAMSNAADQDASGLLKAADVAMYQAKQLGRARYAVFESHLTTKALERLEIEQDLRRALKRDELVIHYQPVFDLTSNRVVELEALLRWQHPERGLLSPSQFIPVAEESGLIVAIGRSMLRTACRQVRDWQIEHPGMEQVKLDVNLSARQFRHAPLVDEILNVLKSTELDPRCLRLEITESDILNELEAAEMMLATLCDAGIELVIDDFGTGYSSLAYLKRFPVTGLKIDRTIIAGLGWEAQDAALVGAAIAAARALRLEVTAEGVETAEQLAALRALGCQRAQGYYFAAPRPADDMRRLITTGLVARVTPDKPARPSLLAS